MHQFLAAYRDLLVVSESTYQPAGDRRSRLYRISAVVLRRRNLGESDRILTVFGREVGKHRLVAKGVRRPGSKLAGHCEPFMLTNMMLARTRGLPILSQAEAQRAFPKLRTDEHRIAIASLMAERVDSLTGEDEAQPGIFELLVNALELLEQGADPDKVQIIFEQVLLREAGYRPELTACVNCGAELRPEPSGFQVSRGGAVCPRCLPAQPGVIPLSVDALKVLRLVDRGEPGRLLGARVPERVIAEVKVALASYIASITGRDSGAARVIRELKLEYAYLDQDQRPEDDDGLPGQAAGS